ncbi:MAG: NAD(+) diphosphatase [Spirochaetia bacterium]
MNRSDDSDDTRTTNTHGTSNAGHIIAMGPDILCAEDGRFRFTAEEARKLAFPDSAAISVTTDGVEPLVATWASPEQDLPEWVEAVSLRSLFGTVSDEQFWTAGKAYQFAHWDRTHRFCGVCGSPTRLDSREVMRSCVSCGKTVYPRISPAIITAVVRDGKLLLAHNAQRAHPFYSVLAGFVEPGETLEECVVREVKEETGITCGSVTYMASQPWPFPDSLMIAFTASHVSGEIEVDGIEIDHAYWCDPHDLPTVPPPPSVARRLINWFVETYG